MSLVNLEQVLPIERNTWFIRLRSCPRRRAMPPLLAQGRLAQVHARDATLCRPMEAPRFLHGEHHIYLRVPLGTKWGKQLELEWAMYERDLATRMLEVSAGCPPTAGAGICKLRLSNVLVHLLLSHPGVRDEVKAWAQARYFHGPTMYWEQILLDFDTCRWRVPKVAVATAQEERVGALHVGLMGGMDLFGY